MQSAMAGNTSAMNNMGLTYTDAPNDATAIRFRGIGNQTWLYSDRYLYNRQDIAQAVFGISPQ